MTPPLCEKCGKPMPADFSTGCCMGTDCHVHEDCLCGNCDTGQFCERHCPCKDDSDKSAGSAEDE